ncbi:MAG: AAA family ATPase [Planctomycetes bacterium]|nr:AAA family ATPase [Planctomycetota bacterium]
MRRIAIINQKGGVGKTTTAANLGAALARAGQRVLVVDLDPQANLSMYLGVETAPEEPSSYGVLCSGTRVAMAVRQTATPGLLLLPSHIDLSGAELELASTFGRETLMRDALERWVREEASEGRGVDFLLFDCPPSLGLLSINGLCAASEVLVVAQTEFFALQGLSKLLGVIELVKQRLNPELELTGVLAALYDSRLRLAREVLGELRRFFPEQTFQTTIAANVRLAESPSHGKTIFDYAPESRGAQDYAALAEEVLAKGAPAGPKDEDLRDKADDLAHADATLRKQGRSAFEAADPEPALPRQAAREARGEGHEAPDRPLEGQTPVAQEHDARGCADSPTQGSVEAAPADSKTLEPRVAAEALAETATAVLQEPAAKPDPAPAKDEWLILHEALISPAPRKESGPEEEVEAVEAEAPPSLATPPHTEESAAHAPRSSGAEASRLSNEFGAGILEDEPKASGPAQAAALASDQDSTSHEHAEEAPQAAASPEAEETAGSPESAPKELESKQAEPEQASPQGNGSTESEPEHQADERRALPGLGWGDYLGEERSRPVWPARRHA